MKNIFLYCFAQNNKENHDFLSKSQQSQNMDENNIIIGKTGGAVFGVMLCISKYFTDGRLRIDFFQSSCLLVENDAIMGCFDKSLIIRNL